MCFVMRFCICVYYVECGCVYVRILSLCVWMCGFPKVWVCVCVDFEICVCVFVWIFKCVYVFISEYCKYLLCVCVDFVIYC